MSREIRDFERFLERVSSDSFFLGDALSAYRTSRRIDMAELAEWLGCDHAALNRLAMCRKPDDRQRSFREDVRTISIFAGCDSDRLLQLLREVASLESLSPSERTGESFLLAARDKNPGADDTVNSGEKTNDPS